MAAPKWFVIAKNEYRIRTSRIRKIRPYFLYLTIGLLSIYVLFIAPQLANRFIGDFLALMLSRAAVAMVQVMLFMIFFYFTIIPITYTLREEQTNQLEIFLAAPVKPSDVLLGEFLGQMPFYAIAITVMAGLFTAILNPLGVDTVQTAIIVIVFVLTVFSALWIGTVVAAILKTRFGKTARGRDIGRALSLIIALPIVAILYAIIGGGLLEALADPGTSGIVKTILGVLPSSWGAEIIVSFVSNPGNIVNAGFGTFIRFGGLIAFFLAILWLGVKAANCAYSLETTTFVASKAKPDGVFYKAIKYLGGGGSFGALLVSVFKDYGRRLENLTKIAYMMGLLVLVNVFLLRPEDAEGVLMMAQLILPLLAAFVVSEVTLHGKENLFIYKKTPSGVGRFVKARLLQGWIVVIPIAAGTTFLSTAIFQQASAIALLTNMMLVILTVGASVLFVLGLFLLNPAFSDKSGNYIVNLIIIMQGWSGLVLVSSIVFGQIFALGLYDAMLFITVPLTWLVGIVFLYLGKRRLSRIE